MSKLALHIAHFKSSQVAAVGRHNWEKRGKHDHHSNQDIDVNKSHLNVQLIRQSASLHKAIKKDIEERCTGRVTSASNWLTEMIVYPPKDLDRQQVIEYFIDVTKFLANRYGISNVKSSVIHFDETTPHLHFDMVPLTKDGKLSTKKLFTRSELRSLHSELAKHLRDKGWSIERGDDTSNRDVKALSVIDYKKQQNGKVFELEKRISKLELINRELEATYKAQNKLLREDIYPELERCYNFVNSFQKRLEEIEEYASEEYMNEMVFLRQESMDLQQKLSLVNDKLMSSSDDVKRQIGNIGKGRD